MKKIKSLFNCKECGSSNTYATTDERVCRRCGNRQNLIKQIKEAVK